MVRGGLIGFAPRTGLAHLSPVPPKVGHVRRMEFVVPTHSATAAEWMGHPSWIGGLAFIPGPQVRGTGGTASASHGRLAAARALFADRGEFAEDVEFAVLDGG